jgi:hypothetical protein
LGDLFLNVSVIALAIGYGSLIKQMSVQILRVLNVTEAVGDVLNMFCSSALT